ncbi:GGDEF domain-containing protein [Arcobacter arenosus]|jgi:diguanylate cyclase (GGDEF)-like protein|uniref:diguanylate cyclase n=1 Tax=Arcobacter arenosus TaxID=2576037 RepID=A0A5R8XX86_9BACT|nr:GGDEF domain-containing protein [Arcobacter arenosus]TLP35769.1 GGDEF domain-containing protein [Arcobacter arenosus]
MYKISVDKELFKNIQFKKTKILEKATSLYWKRELLEPRIENDKIKYTIRQLDKLKITNGLGDDKPQLIIECEKVDYSFKKDLFEFYLGKILEQKNTDIQEDYKDSLIKQLLREKAALEDDMNKDHLTQVYNRRKMEADLDLFINQNNSDLLCTVFIDADRFKGINDNFGHDAGDRVLIYLAKKLQKYAKILNGEVYRYGGEEFVILCFIKKSELISKLNDLRAEIKAQRIYHKIRDISVTVSMGISFFSECKSKDEMLIKADKGVYKAKSNGRDRVEFG